MAEDTHDVQYEEYEESWTGRIAIAAVVALALIAGAFFAGKAMAGDSGPATLADAVQAAQKGELPCGDTGAAAPAPADGANGAPARGGAFLVQALCNRDGAQGRNAGRFRGGAGAGVGSGFGFGQTGQVTAISPDSITIKGRRGDETIKLDSSTRVSKSSSGALSDIKKGDTVAVAGAGPGNPGAAARSVTIIPGATAGS